MTRTQHTSSSRRSLCLVLYLLAVQGLLEADTRQYLPSREYRGESEKELLVELQDVLEKLQSRKTPMWETKLNKVPKCTIGDPCAIKRGARIGKLCDCPRISSCNYLFLKCL